MQTTMILGILTLAEILGTSRNYQGNMILLWVLYGLYKCFTIE